MATYLNRTPSGEGNRKTWTFSTWFKRGTLASGAILTAGSNGQDETTIRVQSDAIDWQLYSVSSSATIGRLITTQLLRDPAAWYHLVCRYDSTNGTAGDRMRMYLNGSEVTSFSTDTNPSLNYDAMINNTVLHNIGRASWNSSDYFSGYFAQTILADGQSYAPTVFGSTNANGIWVPNTGPSVTYGTNGFKLDFAGTGTTADASGFGADTSGNGNHFTPTNLAATDVGIDTPFNNYCTINSVYADDGNNMVAADFSEGNRKQLTTVDGWKFGRGTFLLEAGKWYVEVKMTEAGSGQAGNFGIVPSQGGVTLGNSDDNDVFEGLRVGFSSSDTILQKLDTGSGSNIFTDFASGNTAMLAIDLDNDKIWIGKEGTWYNNNNASTTLSPSNHDIALPTVSLGWAFGLGMSRNGSDNVTFEYNWGNPAHAISSGNSDAGGHGNFEFAVPSGFFAVNSKNLAEYG